jgi:hypothetical protein
VAAAIDVFAEIKMNVAVRREPAIKPKLRTGVIAASLAIIHGLSCMH